MMSNRCYHCGKNSVKKNGIERDGRQRYRCGFCKKEIYISSCEVKSEFPMKGPKILCMDLETTPLEVYVWTLFGNKYISSDNIIKRRNLLSWSAKWLNDSKVFSMVQTPEEAVNRDDSRIVKGLWRLVDEANIIIAHNGDRYDIKVANARFHANKLTPPRPYITIDTLKIAKSVFAFESNSLDYLSELMLNKNKIKTDFDLWKRCLKGDKIALKDMNTYCRYDTGLLEEVYIEIRPWAKGHPNVGIFFDDNNPRCSICGSRKLMENGSYYTTKINQYDSFQCEDCGGFSKSGTGLLTTHERQNLRRPHSR